MKIKNREVKIVKKFKSKRNKVFLVKTDNNKKYVLKSYRKSNFLEKELEIIKKLYKKSVNVPKIISKSNNYILMEYIKGETLLSYILSKEKEKAKYVELNEMFQEIFDWLNNFYNVFDEINIIKGDVNLRNFILKKINGNKIKIYGLDFENIKTGDKEEDIGKMCAFIICYKPEFSNWKKDFIKRFFEFMNSKLELNPDLTCQYYHNELKNIEKRRNLKVKNKIYEILN